LADPRIDPNAHKNDGVTPLWISCHHLSIALLLLADPRVDLNKSADDLGTPLWISSFEGYLKVVQHLLASGREIDTKMISTNTNLTAAEQGRLMTSVSRGANETEDGFHRRKINGPLCADVIEEYEGDAETVRNRLRRLPGLRPFFIVHLFALVVFYSDNFVAINERMAHSDTKRFFKIASQLPLDLQMVLCNRVFGSPRDIILSRDSEPGFRLLARTTTWQQ